MPAGKYSLYLYHDDSRDMQARETIERVSQPLRGEFLRAAAISGALLYRIDVRLPAALAALFVSPLLPGQFTGLLSLLSGSDSQIMAGEGGGKPYPWIAGKYTGSAERRRFILNLNDDASTLLLTQLLDDTSSRQRGALLRELVIAGCALHELDSRFPRLLPTMPEPPVTIAGLNALAGQLLGQGASVKVAEVPVESARVQEPPVSGQSIIRQNMKKLL